MSEAGRLRWRCRRGMRELDQLLEWYLDVRYANVEASTKSAFAELLDRQDPELWSWLTGSTIAPVAAWKQIIDEIRTRDRV